MDPWALKHYQSLGICKIYYSHFIFKVMYHSFRIIVISSESLPSQIFVILNSSCTLTYPKSEKISRESRSFLRVKSKDNWALNRKHMAFYSFVVFSDIK
jgi:hypothetical protein